LRRNGLPRRCALRNDGLGRDPGATILVSSLRAST
jgi:hypothetical protein